ncbi:MAG: ParB/RepB/Spo0J family partition protein [Pseudomonadota bacterium]
MVNLKNEKSQNPKIREISPWEIERNPYNPRAYFRQEEIDTLTSSIRRHGIQVPITVYESDGKFVLLDGERRWRCATKLNLQKIPALVHPKPTDLNNLLMMFNIHALREQWDYLTIALGLSRIIKLFETEHDRKPNEIELSEQTGLTRGQVRRCHLLLDLPERYLEMLQNELELPKQKQRLSEDFFIEMERSLKTVRRRVPEACKDLDAVRTVLIDKYREKIINNVVDLRKVSKIATSVDSLGVPKNKAAKALTAIFARNGVGIADVFAKEFETKYGGQKILRNIDAIINFIQDVLDDNSLQEQPQEIHHELNRLFMALEELLGRE